MPTKLVRLGRVQGYRPTRDQLEEVLELAQRGIDKNAVAKLEHWQGNKQIYSEEDKRRILPENLGQVVKDAGDHRELNNLYFSITQESPVRRVDIEVGPGDWTNYSIESDDPTWAHGRYHEITEKLLADRSLYAKGHASAPQVPKEGTDEWRSAAWELVSDWRASAVNYLTYVLRVTLWSGIIVEIGTILAALIYYYATYTNPEVARNDRHNSDLVFSWFRHNSALLVVINLSYIAMVMLITRWMEALLKSKIVLLGDESSFFSQLGIRKNRDDAVQLAMLYVAFFALVVSIVALII